MPYKNIEDRRACARRSYQKNKEKVLKRQKLKREEDIEEFRKKRREYYSNNKETQNEHSRNHYNNNKEQYRKKQREWRENNKEKYKEYSRVYEKDRYATDTQYKLKKNCRARINHALRGVAAKSAKTQELIGCSIEHLKEHLETQFAEGMSWDNYGEWHLDHIRPCASFDLTDPEQQKECFNYKNLQPLWAYDNMSKGDKYEE